MNIKRDFLLKNPRILLRSAMILWSWIVPIIILGVLALKVYNLNTSVDFFNVPETYHWASLVFCILLLPINMYLEAYKWKVLSGTFQSLKFTSALKIILSGRSLNVISPFGAGGTLTKYAWTDIDKKKQALGAEAIARMTQFVPTILVGTIATFYLTNRGMEIDFDARIVIGIAIFGMVGVLLFIYFYKVSLFKYFEFLNKENLHLLLLAQSISIVRYLVFTFQFYLLFVWIGIPLSPIVALMGISWVFLVKSVIPQLSILGDLIKRELSALFFFQYFEVDLSLIATANFAIWLINIVIPVLVGVFFVPNIKEKL